MNRRGGCGGHICDLGAQKVSYVGDGHVHARIETALVYAPGHDPHLHKGTVDGHDERAAAVPGAAVSAVPSRASVRGAKGQPHRAALRVRVQGHERRFEHLALSTSVHVRSVPQHVRVGTRRTLRRRPIGSVAEQNRLQRIEMQRGARQLQDGHVVPGHHRLVVGVVVLWMRHYARYGHHVAVLFARNGRSERLVRSSVDGACFVVGEDLRDAVCGRQDVRRIKKCPSAEAVCLCFRVQTHHERSRRHRDRVSSRDQIAGHVRTAPRDHHRCDPRHAACLQACI